MGTVTVSHSLVATGVAASFYQSPATGIPDGGFGDYDAGFGCQVQTVGACQVTSCAGLASGDGGAGGDGGAVAGSVVSAGTLSMTGGTGPIALMPDTTTGFYSYSSAYPVGGPTVAGGDTLTVTASGAIVPAFTAHFVMPNDITVTSPVPPVPPMLFGSVAVLRSSDLPIAWTGGGAGVVEVALGQKSGGGLTSITCLLPAAGGSGAIPAAALAGLTPTPAGGMSGAYFTINSSSDVVTVNPSGWQVRVTGIGGGGFFANATIQ
jgi:hypothetical protein